MTYRALKYVATGLLTGDNRLPKEEDVLKALLGMALNYRSNKCTVLNLMTLDKSADIHRLGAGKHMQRRPDMPEDDDSELDIDEDLCYVAASLLASYVSTGYISANYVNSNIHQIRADTAIRDYNAKVTEILESIRINEDGSYGV